MRHTREEGDDYAEGYAACEEDKGSLGWVRVRGIYWERGAFGWGRGDLFAWMEIADGEWRSVYWD